MTHPACHDPVQQDGSAAQTHWEQPGSVQPAAAWGSQQVRAQPHAVAQSVAAAWAHSATHGV